MIASHFKNGNSNNKINYILYIIISFLIINITNKNINFVNGDMVIKWDNPIISNITISTGDQVTWVTTDGFPHTVTSLTSMDLINGEEITIDHNQVTSNVESNLSYYTSSSNKYFQIINSSTFSSDSYTKRKHSVTFTREGIYTYYCKYFNETMVGSIRVLSSSPQASTFSNDQDNQNSKKSLLGLLYATLLGILIFFIIN